MKQTTSNSSLQVHNKYEIYEDKILEYQILTNKIYSRLKIANWVD